MCQDGWWLYHSIFQCLCSDTGAGDWDTRSWDGGLGYDARSLLHCSPQCTRLDSKGGHTHMLSDDYQGIVTRPPSHTHSHCCYTSPSMIWFPAHLWVKKVNGNWNINIRKYRPEKDTGHYTPAKQGHCYMRKPVCGTILAENRNSKKAGLQSL